MIQEATPPIRYSPRPLEEYVSQDGKHGPGADQRVDRVEVWNLAYLSFDYERGLLHPDPQFLTRVRRSCQLDVTTGAVDLTFGANGSGTERLLLERLRMPAPWFVNWLLKNKPVMYKTPLFEAYGQSWLATIERRARLCHTHDTEPEEPLHDLSQATGLLLQFTRR